MTHPRTEEGGRFVIPGVLRETRACLGVGKPSRSRRREAYGRASPIPDPGCSGITGINPAMRVAPIRWIGVASSITSTDSSHGSDTENQEVEVGPSEEVEFEPAIVSVV